MAEHPSPLAPHGEQAPPPVPQFVADAVSHVVPLQQPVGQDAALQAQAPLTHAWPAAHLAPPPHVQLPVPSQPSALMPQPTHAPPPAPHAAAEGVVHVVPVQHPFGQVVALQLAHVPALQMRFPQFWQRPPPAPHVPCWLPGWHAAPEQHPEQDVGSQTHAPFWQCWPVVQAGPLPHVQAPPLEQPSPDVPHPLQSAPPTPHARPVGGEVHTLPVQQPPGHDVELQTQVLFEQT